MISVEEVRSQRGQMLDTLKTLVEFESPSQDKAALDHLAAYIQQRCRDLGGEIQVAPAGRLR